MNCQEAEKYIYLYLELHPREREKTDKHVAACDQCRILFHAVLAQRGTITAANRKVFELPDASGMTRRIIDAVQEAQEKRVEGFRWLSVEPQVKVFRYAMAVVSIILLATFVSEYASEQQIALYKVTPGARQPELNSASFHAAFVGQKEQGKSTHSILYQCVVNCLSAPGGDCEECRKTIQKH